MSGVSAPTSRSWLQLLAAAAAAATVAAGWLELGLAALCLLAVFWPPAVALGPVRAAAVLRVYVPFSIAWFGFVAVYLRLMHSFGATVRPQPQLAQLAEQGLSTPDFLLVAFGVVLLAPLAEEVLFRGYLLAALLTALPRWAAQLATAGAFGLVHGAQYALPIGVLALLFGWLRLRHAALSPAILAHVVHNGATVALAVLWPGHLEWLYPR